MTSTPPTFIPKGMVLPATILRKNQRAVAKSVAQGLLGLGDVITRENIRKSLFNKVEKAQFKVLFDLATRQEIQDVVFVAVSFQAPRNIAQAFSSAKEDPSHTRNCQFGVSVFDTRDIFDKAPEDMISTQNFATGSLSSCAKATKRFIYGTSETISIYDLASKVEEALVRRDDRREGKYRDVVMVCYDGGDEVTSINSLLISANAKPLRGILEMRRIANDVIRAPRQETDSWRLGQILNRLEICVNDPVLPDEPRFLLDIAGNRANFIMRAILTMAVRGYQQSTSTNKTSATIASILMKVANTPFPVRRSAAELDELIGRLPKEPLDDPIVPVDTSKFRVGWKTQQKMKLAEERSARWAAYKVAQKADARVTENVNTPSAELNDLLAHPPLDFKSKALSYIKNASTEFLDFTGEAITDFDLELRHRALFQDNIPKQHTTILRAAENGDTKTTENANTSIEPDELVNLLPRKDLASGSRALLVDNAKIQPKMMNKAMENTDTQASENVKTSSAEPDLPIKRRNRSSSESRISDHEVSEELFPGEKIRGLSRQSTMVDKAMENTDAKATENAKTSSAKPDLPIKRRNRSSSESLIFDHEALKEMEAIFLAEYSLLDRYPGLREISSRQPRMMDWDEHTNVKPVPQMLMGM